MAEISIASRRDFLGIAALAPVIGAGGTGSMLAAGRLAYQPIPLRRTRGGRQLSRIRYRNAESFFAPLEQGFPFRQTDRLYQVGIVLQLALSSHLLDVGIDDAWCAKNIGLYVNRSLEHANATGLGHDSPELKMFAEFLSPYGRLRNAGVSPAADASPFSHEHICRLTRELLERVREITGHPRPRGRTQSNG